MSQDIKDVTLVMIVHDITVSMNIALWDSGIPYFSETKDNIFCFSFMIYLVETKISLGNGNSIIFFQSKLKWFSQILYVIWKFWVLCVLSPNKKSARLQQCQCYVCSTDMPHNVHISQILLELWCFYSLQWKCMICYEKINQKMLWTRIEVRQLFYVSQGSLDLKIWWRFNRAKSSPLIWQSVQDLRKDEVSTKVFNFTSSKK